MILESDLLLNASAGSLGVGLSFSESISTVITYSSATVKELVFDISRISIF